MRILLRHARWWVEDRWGEARDWWYYRTKYRGRVICDSPELQALVKALESPWFGDGFNHGPCPLHPKNISTPFARRCCYSSVLLIEDLSPVMRCVTYNESSIKLRKKENR